MQPFKVFGKTIGHLRYDRIFIKKVTVKDHFYRKGYGWCFSWDKLHKLSQLGCREIRIIADGGNLDNEKDYILINDNRLPNKGEQKVFRTSPSVWIQKGFPVHYKNFETQYCLPLKYFYKQFLEKNSIQKKMNGMISIRYDGGK